MVSFWWVNHKQTLSQEISGGYLWSPKRERNGNRSQYYEFMRQARPGDRIVSFAKAQIAHAGVISGFPICAPQPDEFGAIGNNWATEGWYVPVSWDAISMPFRPKDYIDRIRPYLPEKYSPIQSNGNGNQKAYLTQISLPFTRLLAELGGFEANAILNSDDYVDSRTLIEGIEDRVEKAIAGDASIDDTQRSSLILARRGQGKFRKDVEAIEPSCRISGLHDKRLLIASHIKPWRVCSDATERLDGSNGLLLAPHADKLFDIGLISFDKDGSVLISDTLDKDSREALNLQDAIQNGVGEFSDAQGQYLKFHREEIFLG